MPQLDDELKDAIKKGVSLEKPDEAELKKLEEERQKRAAERAEELKKIEAAMKKD